MTKTHREQLARCSCPVSSWGPIRRNPVFCVACAVTFFPSPYASLTWLTYCARNPDLRRSNSSSTLTAVSPVSEPLRIHLCFPPQVGLDSGYVNITHGLCFVNLLVFRGPASTLPSMPGLWPAICHRTNSPSSTACGSLWSRHPLSTPSWSWSLSTLWSSWWRLVCQRAFHTSFVTMQNKWMWICPKQIIFLSF